MKSTDYDKELDKITDFDLEIISIADCRRAMSELNERQDILNKLISSVKKDIKSVESGYLKKRALIREKYNSKGSSGLLNSLKGPFAATRVKEMKKLESERIKSLESYYEIKYVSEDLLVQIEDMQDSVKTMMREMLGNF
ncbi:MAG: hypothetical protein LLF83_09705 [Methanobacterium sp.]|nr:hypothetical protein [Methanobacterium sp.]